MMFSGSTRSIVGLEVDPGCVRAAEVEVNGRLRVRRAAEAPLQPGIVRDGEVVDAPSLTEAIRQLWRANKGLGRRVRVGIANQRIVMRWVELPPIDDDKQLDAAVRFAAQDTIPMPLETAVLDWQRGGVIETPSGPRLRVMVVAARRDMVERVLEAVRAAGLRVDGIDLSAFAMMRATVAQDDGPTVHLAIGGITNLAVAEAGMCTFTRVSGGGLESIAVDLAERRGLTMEHSRAWLAHVGVARPLEEIEGDPEIVAAARESLIGGIQRIGAEVRTSLDFHAMQSETAGGASVERVIVTGPVTAIDGFTDHLGETLGMPVEERVVDIDPKRVASAPGAVTVAAGLAVEEAPA